MSNDRFVKDLNSSIGVQLFAIQQYLEKDFTGTLKKLAAMGYSEVEVANVSDKESAKSLKQALDALGLTCQSAHFFAPMLLGHTADAIEIAQTLGIKYMVSPTPWVADPSRRRKTSDPQQDFIDLMLSLTLDDWKWNAEQFNSVGEQIKQAGLQFGYHHHGFDFKFTEGEIPFEFLLHHTDADLVAIELDCGWVANAGYDPVDFITQYPERIKLLHIKDVLKKAPTTNFDMQSVAVGQGCIDWRSVFRAAKAAGVDGYFVEMEPPFVSPPLEMFQRSYDFLQTLDF